MSTKYSYLLNITAPLRKRLFLNIINSIGLKEGSYGLDAGCGTGLHSMMLAKQIGIKGRLAAADISEEFLAEGRQNADKSGITNIDFVKGSLYELPFEDNTFDWAWSVDAACYGTGHEVLAELKRVIKPGGKIFILAWSSQMFLPGYPELEAKLNATKTGVAPFKAGYNPDNHFLNLIGSLKKYGFSNCRPTTFIDPFHAPLEDNIKEAIREMINMRWNPRELPKKDAGLFARLCSPDSKEYILNKENYMCFFTYTMFSGEA